MQIETNYRHTRQKIAVKDDKVRGGVENRIKTMCCHLELEQITILKIN